MARSARRPVHQREHDHDGRRGQERRNQPAQPALDQEDGQHREADAEHYRSASVRPEPRPRDGDQGEQGDGAEADRPEAPAEKRGAGQSRYEQHRLGEVRYPVEATGLGGPPRRKRDDRRLDRHGDQVAGENRDAEEAERELGASSPHDERCERERAEPEESDRTPAAEPGRARDEIQRQRHRKGDDSAAGQEKGPEEGGQAGDGRAEEPRRDVVLDPFIERGQLGDRILSRART